MSLYFNTFLLRPAPTVCRVARPRRAGTFARAAKLQVEFEFVR